MRMPVGRLTLNTPPPCAPGLLRPHLINLQPVEEPVRSDPCLQVLDGSSAHMFRDCTVIQRPSRQAVFSLPGCDQSRAALRLRETIGGICIWHAAPSRDLSSEATRRPPERLSRQRTRMASIEKHSKESNIDVHALLQDIAACEGRARSLCGQLTEDPKLGFNCETVDYGDVEASKQRIRKGKEMLSRLKVFGTALRSIQACVEYSIYKIADALSPLVLHDGIMSLPDEILAAIFEEAVDLNRQDTKSTLTLASVSRRFRDVALRLPGLWSSLSYTRRSKFKLFLERSGDVGLTVFLGSRTPHWYRKEVLPLSHRWRKAIICEPEGVDGNILKLTDDEGKIFCPILQAISVDLPFNRYSPIDLGSTFTVPALQHLRMSNIIPTLSQQVSASLTSFQLQFKAPDGVSQAMISASPLLRPLSLMHNLQKLSLSFGSIELTIDSDSPTCNFPHLRRFNIELSGETDDDGLGSFLDKLVMTRVQSVFVKLKVEDEMHSWISNIFHPTPRLLASLDPRFPSLEDAVIIVESLYRRRNKVFIFMDNLLGFPQLKTLYIHAPDIYFLDSRTMDTRRLCLRTLTIKECNTGVRKFLDHLLAHVNPDGTKLCNSMERLEILGCPEVSRNYLMDHLPREKIGWSLAVDGNYTL